MKTEELKSTITIIKKSIPSNVDGTILADLYVRLGSELGLEHLLIPEARPTDALDLPTTAPEFYQDRCDKSELPHEYIERVYADWLGKGLARHHILQLDKPLYMALANWLKKNDLPVSFDLPTKKELADRDLARLGLKEGDTLPYPSYYTGLKDKLRLYNAARNRKK